MSSIVEQLAKKDLITPPKYVTSQIQYETIVGSISYGVADTTNKDHISDWDICGFCIPYKDMIFPHLRGEIVGFGIQTKRFDQYQQHHIYDKTIDRKYDISIYNIIKYFQLVMENNPNMIDSLFTPQRCVLLCSQIGNLVRENRKLFLHRGSWFKFKSYSYSQMHKAKDKTIVNLANFLNDHNISQNPTLDQVEEEMKRRNLL